MALALDSVVLIFNCFACRYRNQGLVFHRKVLLHGIHAAGDGQIGVVFRREQDRTARLLGAVAPLSFGEAQGLSLAERLPGEAAQRVAMAIPRGTELPNGT